MKYFPFALCFFVMSCQSNSVPNNALIIDSIAKENSYPQTPKEGNTNEPVDAEDQENSISLMEYGYYGKWFVPKAGIGLLLDNIGNFKLEGISHDKDIIGTYTYEAIEDQQSIMLNFAEPQSGEEGDLIFGKDIKVWSLAASYNPETKSYYLSSGAYFFVKGDD